MDSRSRPLALVCSAALCAVATVARADMYTWTDAAGRVNISNIAPPEGARIADVRHDVAPKVPPPDPAWEAARAAERAAEREREMQALADRARELEVQVLSERVRSLEREVELTQRRTAAAFDYPPQPVQYYAEAPQASPGCDPSWAGCGWNTGWWGGGVVVVNAAPYRRHLPYYAGWHNAQRFVGSRPVAGGGHRNGGGAPPRRR